MDSLSMKTRTQIEDTFLKMTKKKHWKHKALELQLAESEVIDVTLTGKRKTMSDISHPNTIALEEVERIFIGMGYEVVEGPEVEYRSATILKSFEYSGKPSGKG